MAWLLPKWLPASTTLMNVSWGVHDTDLLQYQVGNTTLLNLYQSRDGVRTVLFDGRSTEGSTEQLGPYSVTVERVKGGADGWFAYAPNNGAIVGDIDRPDTIRLSFTVDGTWVGLMCSGDPLPDISLRRVVSELLAVTFDEYAEGISPFTRPGIEAESDEILPAARPDRSQDRGNS